MKRTFALITLVGAAVTSSFAATSYINFGNSAEYTTTGTVTSGTSTTTLNGTTNTSLTYTVSAYSGTTLGNLTSVSSNPILYSGAGLGICGPGDVAGCGSNDHQADNHSQYEYFLFTFGTAVDLGNLVVQNFGSVNGGVDVDFSYWFSSSSTATVTALVGGTQNNSDRTGVASSTDYTTDIAGTGVRSLLIGARIGAGADATTDSFKLRSLELLDSTAPGGAVPEPATFVLAGAALVGLGFARRKRSAKA